jgi:hypothetical protein
MELVDHCRKADATKQAIIARADTSLDPQIIRLTVLEPFLSVKALVEAQRARACVELF